MSVTTQNAPSDNCRACGQSHYDCLCNGDNHIPREARTRLPPPLAERTCQMPIPEAEWMERLRKRFAERAAMSDEDVQAVADACTFAEWSDGFEDDPEGAADEEMSYWAADE